MRPLAFGRLHIRINSYVVIRGKSDTNPSRTEKVILSPDGGFLFFSRSRSLNICERACLPYMRQSAAPLLGRVRDACHLCGTRASVRACLRACMSARLAVTYMRARAYDLFLAGVSQPPDALFGTTRCHAPVPPLPSLALASLSVLLSWCLSPPSSSVAVCLSALYCSPSSLLSFNALFIFAFRLSLDEDCAA